MGADPANDFEKEPSSIYFVLISIGLMVAFVTYVILREIREFVRGW